MSLVAKQPESIPPVPGGTYQGICYSLIDIGTQHSVLFNQDLRQVIITWEIPGVRIDIEKEGQMVSLPRAISRTYTNSLSEKANLYAHLISWRGAEFTREELDNFDLRKILGRNCLLTIVNKLNKKNKMVANVAAVAKLMKEMKVRKPENPIVSFDMDEDGITNIPANVPDWIKKMIQESVEYKAVMYAQNNPDLAAAQATVVHSHSEDEDETVPEPGGGDEIPF